MSSGYNITRRGGRRFSIAIVFLILLGAGAVEAATISGTVFTDEGVTNARAGHTVRLIVNGVDLGNNATDASGAYSITASINSGDAYLVYVDNAALLDGTTVAVSDGAGHAGFDDADFSAGNYTAQGPFITIRMKVDQDTVRNLATGGNLPWKSDRD
ncbi:hypothetical protein MnTg04_01088 [bacterium MnTg04]|nr:hypothetical protein MnTg04_01088 [bacterium MnTg04]